MFNKLLIMTDGSPVSYRLLDCVEGLRACGTREVVLCHVVEVETAAGLYDYLRAHLLPRLEAQKERLEGAGFRASIEIPLGEPHVEANRLVQALGCSMIVVASHSHGLSRDLLMGVTACSLIRHAIVPVFLARVEILLEECGSRCRTLCRNAFEHLLFPTDFSDTAEAAFAWVEEIASACRSRVTLLHVQDKARIEPYLSARLEEFNRIDQQRLERMKQSLTEKDAGQVEVKIAFGHPTEEILREADSGACTLIVMGSHGRGFFAKDILGGVAHNIANHAPLPVIFTPASGT